jgi:hypothetical protein
VFSANETEELLQPLPAQRCSQAASLPHHGAGVRRAWCGSTRHDLSIVPGLASSWEVDASGHGVHVRACAKGVRFHDDPCFSRRVKVASWLTADVT